MTILASPLDSKNKRNNQERYVRIAFESLEEFGQKTNRKNNFIVDEHNPDLRSIVLLINSQQHNRADSKLKELIYDVSKKIAEAEWGIKYYQMDEDYFSSTMVAESGFDDNE